MRLPAALVTSVLIWSSARYLPPYYLEMHRMDLEEDRTVVEQTRDKALSRQMRLKMPPAREAKPAEQERKFY